ncbi:MAG: hypothetical protein V3U06_09820, partial [Candidatus Binatia bacterium]
PVKPRRYQDRQSSTAAIFQECPHGGDGAPELHPFQFSKILHGPGGFHRLGLRLRRRKDSSYPVAVRRHHDFLPPFYQFKVMAQLLF